MIKWVQILYLLIYLTNREVYMDILFAIRADYKERIGGDTFQFLFTKRQLENDFETNIIVIREPEEIENYPDVQVVHVFNMQERLWTYSFLKKAKECGKKTILSTIYWDLSDAEYISRMVRLTSDVRQWKFFRPFKSVISRLSDAVRKQDVGGSKKLEEYRELLQLVDLILPNSYEEAKVVERIFGHFDYQICTIPNAIAPPVDKYCVKDVPQEHKGCILQVGRVEPIKNQGAVIQACMDNDIPIVFIGKIFGQRYYEKIKKLANKRGNVYFLGEMPQEEIAAYYNAAKVHVLPSFRESPGLVTLEAMYYGCNVVVANEDYCPVEYYQFDKYAYICDPYSIASIREAIHRAYHDEKKEYSEDYFRFISYENVAKLTHEAYKLTQKQ